MPDISRRIIPFETRSNKEDGSEFDGYGSAYHTIDTYQTFFSPNAFDDSLEEFRNSGFVGGVNHDWDNPLGKPLDAKSDLKGLFVRCSISATTKGLDARILIKDGVIKKLSIGFIIEGRTWFDNADDVKAHWQSVGYTPTAQDLARCEYGACLITRARLLEVSPVTLPSNSLCDITAVRGVEAPAALTLDEHVLKVLDANKTVLKRLADVGEKRVAQDRTLSPQRLSQIVQMRSDLDALLQSPALSAAPAPSESEADEAANAAYALFLESALED